MTEPEWYEDEYFESNASAGAWQQVTETDTSMSDAFRRITRRMDEIAAERKRDGLDPLTPRELSETAIGDLDGMKTIIPD